MLTYTIPMPQAVLTSESASVLDFVQSGPPNLDVNGAEKSGHCGGVMMAHPYYARNSSEDCNSHDPYPSTCWMVQRLTSRRLASSRWLTPLDRSLPDVLPLLPGQDRSPAGETALGPRLRLTRDRALPDRVPPPFAEGEHHLELELPVGGGRVEVL